MRYNKIETYEIDGFTIYPYKKVNSTMQIAEEFAKENRCGIIIAEEQEQGRGRYGRYWFSPPGGLYLSWIVPQEENFPSFFSEMISMTIVRTLGSFEISCKIKLPNDIIVNDKKIAGILLIKKADCYIAGIGINVNNPTGGADRISMKDILGDSVEKEELLRVLVKNFLCCKEQFTEDFSSELLNWSKYLIK